MELKWAIIRKDYEYLLTENDRVVKRKINTIILDKYYDKEDAIHDMKIRNWFDDDTTTYEFVEIEDETKE